MYDGLFRHEEWNIGIASQPISAFLEGSTKPRIHWFPRPRHGMFLADPFGLTYGQMAFILCEEYDYNTATPRIIAVKIDAATRPSVVEPAVGLPVRASYPYLIEHQGSVYCIPEAYQTGEIALYRAAEFPYRWTKVDVLVSDFAGLDSTVFQHDGRWWLFCTSQEYGSLDRLFIWYADDLVGPWRSHTRNPVKTDIRSSRPAGTPFVHDSYLYRPAQDCSRTYGGRIVLNRVVRLSPHGFEEEPSAFVEPDPSGPYPNGLHTISALGNVTVIDGKRFTFVRSAFKRALMKRFTKPGTRLLPMSH